MRAVDHVKNINISIEKIIDNIVDMLCFLKVNESTKMSEMKSVVFAKHKMLSLVEHVHNIFKELIALKYIGKRHEYVFENEDKDAFSDLFKRLV